jgi:glutathione synthase/RimK-type ligase-like ATP-grasp enzyme
MTPDPQAQDRTSGQTSTALIGLPTLMHMALSGVDLMPKGQELLRRAEADPDDANALMDLSTVLQLTGQPAVARTMQAEALQTRQLYHLPAARAPVAVRVLALMAPGELMANTPLEFLVQGSDVSLDMLYVGEGVPPPTSVPQHDILFVAVAESDRTRPLLNGLERMVESWPSPVLNRPERIVRLSRDGACDLLEGLPGVDLPRSARIDRNGLEAVGRRERSIRSVIGDGDFPVIVRPVGSHAGRGLVRLDNAEAIAPYLQTLVDDEFYVARFVDYRGRDGLFRKYRIVFVEGRPFLAHMAISENWMIHYLNAGMSESETKRAEEARVMASFDEDFARRHAPALQGIVDRVGLDYFGIDCAETPDGDLLIFEVDSALVVHAMDPVDVFPYKPAQMQKIFDAFREMLRRRAAAGQG